MQYKVILLLKCASIQSFLQTIGWRQNFLVGLRQNYLVNLRQNYPVYLRYTHNNLVGLLRQLSNKPTHVQTRRLQMLKASWVKGNFL